MTAHWTRRLTAGALLLTGCGGRTSESLFERTNQPDAPATPTTEWSTPGRPDVPVPEPAPVVVPDPEEIECAPGELACSDSCVDIEVDAKHCGACNAPCDAGLVCATGQCELGPRSWKSEAALSLPSNFSEDVPLVVINDDGVVVVLWVEFEAGSSTRKNLFSSRFDPSEKTWSTPHQLNSRPLAYDQQLLLHPEGYPIAVWRQNNIGYYATDEDLDGEWSSLVNVAPSYGVGPAYRADVTTEGNLWFSWRDSFGQIRVGTLEGSTLGEGQMVGVLPANAVGFAASEDQFLLTWLNDENEFFLADQRATESGSPVTFDGKPNFSGGVALDGVGRSVAVWPRQNGETEFVELVASVNGEDPDQISNAGGSRPSICRAEDGVVVAAWQTGIDPAPGSASVIQTTRLVDGVWSESEEIGAGTGETEVIGSTIGASATGHVAVAFQVRSETPRIWLNRFSPGVDGWQGASEVPGQSTWGYSPTAATNSFGDVAVAWKSGGDEPAIQVRVLTR